MFSEPGLANAQRVEASKEVVIRKPTRTLTSFELTDGVFFEDVFQKHVRLGGHPMTQRVGFGPSTNLAVTTLVCTPSSDVAITKIKLVPTIEAYLTNYLKSVNRENDFNKLIKTAALRVKPPSAFLRLVDSYLFNHLRK